MQRRNQASLYAQSMWATSVAMTLLVAGGCKPSEESANNADALREEVALRVLVIDDEPLAEAVKLAWDSRVGGNTKVRNMSTAKLLTTEKRRLNADVILYPSSLMGELAVRDVIFPLDAEDTADPVFDRQGIFELMRLHEITWGSVVYAVPLGSPQFTLFYRKDIFAALNIDPPTTWAEYQAAAKKLSDRSVVSDFITEDQPQWFGTVEPVASGWAGAMLLARAAAYARHRNQYSTLFDFSTMQPRIASPPFERALEELAATVGEQNGLACSPTDARRMLLAGQCAMAISWPSRADDQSPDEPSERSNWIGVAELPGSKDVFNFPASEWEQRGGAESPHVSLMAIDGRLGSVVKTSPYKQQALGMLFMLAGDELGTTIGSSSSHTTMFRTSQLAAANAWVDLELSGDAARQYSEAVEASQSRGAWLDAIRIPGRAQYMDALDQAVASVVSDEASAKAALEAAAEQWNEATESIGQTSQQQAYMRSLGLEP